MNKKINIITTVILAFFLAGIILYPKIKPLIASKFGSKSSQVSVQRRPQQMLNVTGYIIAPTHLSDYVRSTGTLRPDEEVDLSFETSGKIVGINFTEGTRVKKGQLLAKINDQPLKAQFQKLSAELKMAEAKEFRQRNLLNKDAISQESYDQIVTEVQTINADINLVKAQIAMTELRAPFDGIIGLRYLSEGSYANPSTKIAKLIKNSPIKIEFSIPEKYASEIRIGFPITFSIDGINKVFEASVYAIDPKIDIETRTIVLRALYPNRNEELKTGRYAGITLEMSNIDNAIAIPTEALIPEMEGEKVFIYNNGRAKSVKVEIGLRTESKIQILKGLKFGDTLLVTGILQLRQSIPVVLDSIMVNN
jgi:membrane fusion protein (multidrug efflux system)